MAFIEGIPALVYYVRRKKPRVLCYPQMEAEESLHGDNQ